MSQQINWCRWRRRWRCRWSWRSCGWCSRRWRCRRRSSSGHYRLQRISTVQWTHRQWSCSVDFYPLVDGRSIHVSPVLFSHGINIAADINLNVGQVHGEDNNKTEEYSSQHSPDISLQNCRFGKFYIEGHRWTGIQFNSDFTKWNDTFNQGRDEITKAKYVCGCGYTSFAKFIDDKTWIWIRIQSASGNLVYLDWTCPSLTG